MFRVRPLQTLRKGYSQCPHQVRVFAIRLLGPAPARIAAQIRIGRAHHHATTAEGWILIVVARLKTFQTANLLKQVCVPGGAKSLLLRKGRRRHRLPASTSPATRPAERKPVQSLHLAGEFNAQARNLWVVRHQQDLLLDSQPAQQVRNTLVVGQLRVTERIIRLRRKRPRQPQNKPQPNCQPSKPSRHRTHLPAQPHQCSLQISNSEDYHNQAALASDQTFEGSCHKRKERSACALRSPTPS